MNSMSDWQSIKKPRISDYDQVKLTLDFVNMQVVEEIYSPYSPQEDRLTSRLRRALSEQSYLLRIDCAFSYLAMPNPVSFRYFKTSLEIIQLAVMLYVRFPLSLRNVEDLLHERGVDVSYESVRYWWHRFGSQTANQIKKRGARVCSPEIENGTWMKSL